MHRILLYAAFSWLALSGVSLFLIDVVLQYARGTRKLGPETTLYYGLNSSYALGQLIVGLLCLRLVHVVPQILDSALFEALLMIASLGWLVIAFLSMHYREPKIVAIIYVLVLLAAIVTA